MKILVQSETFDLGAEVDAMRAGRTDIGAIASFVGLARDLHEGCGVQAMTLEVPPTPPKYHARTPVCIHPTSPAQTIDPCTVKQRASDTQNTQTRFISCASFCGLNANVAFSKIAQGQKR